MNEKTRKYLIILAYRVAFALGIFLILFALSFFSPNLIEKLSPIWTKNTNLRKAGSYLLKFAKEIFPF